MAEVLELPHLPQHDAMPQVQVRGGRVHPQLDPQRPAFNLNCLVLVIHGLVLVSFKLKGRAVR